MCLCNQTVSLVMTIGNYKIQGLASLFCFDYSRRKSAKQVDWLEDIYIYTVGSKGWESLAMPFISTNRTRGGIHHADKSTPSLHRCRVRKQTQWATRANLCIDFGCPCDISLSIPPDIQLYIEPLYNHNATMSGSLLFFIRQQIDRLSVN